MVGAANPTGFLLANSKGGCLKSMIPAREETWDAGGKILFWFAEGMVFFEDGGSVRIPMWYQITILR